MNRGAWVVFGLAGLALAASVSTANGEASKESTQSWLNDLKDRWLIIESSQVQVSHPQVEIFCSDGRWFASAGNQQNIGTYSFAGGRLCVMRGSSYKMCRILSKQRDGRLIARSDGGSRDIMEIRPASANTKSEAGELDQVCSSKGIQP
ncbi:MAG: hypothetical protein Q8Q88_22625 [Phenylobacterium sp.]|uniref:hypothetical protein n=1 Tax=Phenylobacterium sp. TaxID=1871053 RepID=UPI0027331B15|nr:hypothetical protein [Phenylobacterium sp.]MDP3749835.1 hypothetical protein [Phenylobacterium sp.]